MANDAPVAGTAAESIKPDDLLAPIGDHESVAGLSEVEIRRSGRKRVAPTLLDEVAGKAVRTKAGAMVGAWRTVRNKDEDEGEDEDEDDDMDDVGEDSEWEEEHLMTDPASVYATNLHVGLR